MPKGRHLKVEFWTDANIVALTPLARLLYLGLWHYAADCGHLADAPSELKLRILPTDDCDVDALLQELVAHGRIERSDGTIYIPTLRAHQRVDKRYETACTACRTLTGAAPAAPRAHAVTTPSARRDHAVHTAGTHRDHDADGDGDGDGSKHTCASADAERVHRRVQRAADAQDFGTFWAAYPRKRSKATAAKAYARARKTTSAEDILLGLKRVTPEWSRRPIDKVPYPATWLNAQGWEDQPDAPPPPPVADENAWMRMQPDDYPANPDGSWTD